MMRSTFVTATALSLLLSVSLLGCAGVGAATSIRAASTPTIATSSTETTEPEKAELVVVEGKIAESPDLLKLVVALPFEDVEMTLRAELAQRNLNIVNELDIQQALAGRGTEFPRYVVFQVCNLQDGLTLFYDHEDYGAFIPCSILVYEKDGKTILVTRRPSAIVHKVMGHTPKADSVAVAKRMEGEMRGVLEVIAEEAQAAL